MSIAYLESLNREQRQAVEHGVTEKNAAPGPPLLVIAGAGSGKTNTLAHRVAHLIVNGANPRRILLMTFSRRAAAEMTRRVERIARQVIGNRARTMTDTLTWAGTFHGIGARLLREYADRIGLDPAFTIAGLQPKGNLAADSLQVQRAVKVTTTDDRSEARPVPAAALLSAIRHRREVVVTPIPDHVAQSCGASGRARLITRRPAGNNAKQPRPLRLEAQDTALSRRQHRFESGRGRHSFQ